MSSLEVLSDSELRTKLMEYGYPVGPVTQTTRKILLKKLKNLMDSRNAGSRHSMAAKYSSDDTDDDISALSKKKKKTSNTRRQTLANPMPPPAMVPAPISTTVPKSPSKKRMSTRIQSPSETESLNSNNSLVNIGSRTVSKSEKSFTKNNKSSKDSDGLETGSDSDAVEEPTKKSNFVTKFGGGLTKLYDNNQSTSSGKSKEFKESPRSHETNRNLSGREPPDTSNSHNKKEEKYSLSYPKPNLTLENNKNDSHIRDTSKADDILANYETPYLSDFTRRLSVQSSINFPSNKSLKESKYRLSSLNSTPEGKGTDLNGHYNSPRSYTSNLGVAYVTSSLDKTRDVNKNMKQAPTVREDNKNSPHIVSKVLVIVLALFFGFLAVVYLGLEGKSDSFPALPADSDIPICSSKMIDQNNPGTNCILEENLKDIGFLLKIIHPILIKKAISAECDGKNELPYLTDGQIIHIITSETGEKREKIQENLNNAHLLIYRNPKWGMSLVEILDNSESYEMIDSMDNVYSARLNHKLGLLIKNPEIPLQCQIKKYIMTAMWGILVVASVILLVIGVYKSVNIYYQRQENKEKEVFNLVSKIIEMLEQHHQNFATASPGGTQESYLAINHIRDNLISPKDRKKFTTLWDKAVKFLDENESRIRREVQLVAGEEFQVWRWLPSNTGAHNSPSSSPIKMSKVWLGSAFEKMDGSLNCPSFSPTPCLKIRNMFDPDVEVGEDWETRIKDALLEKCGENVKILHIKVDRNSQEGCVYLKCLSQEEAGKAYKALLGSWFDGHLITVKYLRLGRYHERFPESINFTTPLKPSNNQRLSMQMNSCTNSSEAN